MNVRPPPLPHPQTKPYQNQLNKASVVTMCAALLSEPSLPSWRGGGGRDGERRVGGGHLRRPVGPSPTLNRDGTCSEWGELQGMDGGPRVPWGALSPWSPGSQGRLVGPQDSPAWIQDRSQLPNWAGNLVEIGVGYGTYFCCPLRSLPGSPGSHRPPLEGGGAANWCPGSAQWCLATG